MAKFEVNGGDIPWRYFDMESYDHTFKIYAPRLNFTDIFDSVVKIVRAEDVRDVCKVDSNTFNVTVMTEDAYDLLNNVGSIIVRDRSYKVVNISNQILEFKVHWLPTYIRDSFIEDYFSRYGRVISVSRENMVYTANDVKSSGIRRVMLETDEVQKRSLPYIVKFNGGYTALVTMAGRPPYCLKCKTVGHIRRDCDQTPVRRTYADATATRNVNITPGISDTNATSATETTNVNIIPTSDTSSKDLTSTQTSTSSEITCGQPVKQQQRASLDLTGSTIPPNQPKRPLDSQDDDDDDDEDDQHGDGLMIDSEREKEIEGWQTSHGKKVKVLK